MNMGMAFNQRPNKAPPSRMGGMSFKRFARQMGMEPEELGAVTPWIVWANGEVDLRLYDFADKDGPET